MTDKNWCVYKHTNLVNGKIYIGITSKKPNQRWRDGQGYWSNKYFHNAIQKYGWNEGFSHEILENGLSEEEAKQKEIEYIAKFNSLAPNGYNQTIGGEGCRGWKMTDEQKKAISLRNKGLKRSPEICEFLRRRQLGKKHTEETKRKMSKSQTGRKHTEESIQKMRIARKAIGIPPEATAAAAEWHKKPILQYTLQGEFVREWNSAADASKELGISQHGIYRCVNGSSKSSAGYVWERKEEIA